MERTEPLRLVHSQDSPFVRRVPTSWMLRNWAQYRYRELPERIALAAIRPFVNVISLEPCLVGSVYHVDRTILAPWLREKLTLLLRTNVDVHELPRHFGGFVLDYGVLSRRKVTTAGVGFLVDAWQNSVEMENMKYHGFGTGTNAESNADSALQTELTTQYATDNTRPTGSLTEGASANIFRTVGTLAPDSGGTIAVTEHGIFSQAANSGGVLWDRSVFTAVNLVAGADSLQVTYDLTASAEA